MTVGLMDSRLPEHDLILPTILQLQGLLHLFHDLHDPKIEASFSSCRGGVDGEGVRSKGNLLLKFTWKIHGVKFREFVF